MALSLPCVWLFSCSVRDLDWKFATETRRTSAKRAYDTSETQISVNSLILQKNRLRCAMCAHPRIPFDSKHLLCTFKSGESSLFLCFASYSLLRAQNGPQPKWNLKAKRKKHIKYVYIMLTFIFEFAIFTSGFFFCFIFYFALERQFAN